MPKKIVRYPKPANGISCEKVTVEMTEENIRLSECNQIIKINAELGNPPLDQDLVDNLKNNEREFVLDWFKKQRAIRLN